MSHNRMIVLVEVRDRIEADVMQRVADELRRRGEVVQTVSSWDDPAAAGPLANLLRMAFDAEMRLSPGPSPGGLPVPVVASDVMPQGEAMLVGFIEGPDGKRHTTAVKVTNLGPSPGGEAPACPACLYGVCSAHRQGGAT